MINLYSLESIINDPPADLLELYSRLCDCHSYTYGDNVRLGKIYSSSAAAPTSDATFVEISKRANAGDAILGTCQLGGTIDGVTTYSPRLGFFLRGYDISTYVTTLKTVVLGKPLGTHIAEAMGYEDYLVVRSRHTNVVGIDGNAASCHVMPLVIPPGVVFGAEDPDHYLVGDATANQTIFDSFIAANPAARVANALAVDGEGSIVINPPAWFCTPDTFDGAVIPLSVYITDDQCWATVNDRINVMQQQRIDTITGVLTTLSGEVGDANTDVAALQNGYASVVALVGSLAVFGNSVKEVTERYNTMNQYIPRP